jgi:molybdate transport system ATP-binding protein
VSGLLARLVVERGDFRLQLDLDVAPGEVVALLGPNGAGKSTALAALAGAVPLSAGSVRLDDRVLADAGTGAIVDPSRRSVGWVLQDALLFPHLSAGENVAFGLRAGGMRRGEATARAAEELGRLGIAELVHARSREISGGQAQRVALARALAPRPRLLLLDEPLAALDVEVRDSVRADLGERLRQHDGCTVLVTHDPVDAERLADRIVVVERGRAVQRGGASELRAAPATAYVAAMFPADPRVPKSRRFGRERPRIPVAGLAGRSFSVIRSVAGGCSRRTRSDPGLVLTIEEIGRSSGPVPLFRSRRGGSS